MRIVTKAVRPADAIQAAEESYYEFLLAQEVEAQAEAAYGRALTAFLKKNELFSEAMAAVAITPTAASATQLLDKAFAKRRAAASRVDLRRQELAQATHIVKTVARNCERLNLLKLKAVQDWSERVAE